MAGDKWLTLKSARLFELPGRIAVDLETVQLPDGTVIDDYLQVGMASYAVVYAQTANGKVICLYQYKHGPRRASVTLPAGQLEPGEEPLAAARRELREETGYEGDGYQLLGSFTVNGSQGCGTAHVIRATNCRLMYQPTGGDLEEMELGLKTPQELRDALFSGEVGIVGHALAIAIGLLSAADAS